MPAFRKSPPELVARFDELALLASDADRRQVFGYPVCVLRGNMFIGLHENASVTDDEDAVAAWVRRSRAYAEQLPPKKAKKKS